MQFIFQQNNARHHGKDRKPLWAFFLLTSVIFPNIHITLH